MKRVLVLLITTGLWFSAFTPVPIKGQNQASRVPGKQDPGPQVEQDPKPQVKFRRVEQAIPNRYIVVFNENSLGIKESVSQPDDDRTDQSDNFARQRDEIIGQKVEARAFELARAHRGIIGHVYKHALRGFSAEMTENEAMALSENPEVKYVEEDGLASIDFSQANAPWGLDRIDQRDRPLNSTYTYNNTGAGVNAYVIDSGIRTSHDEFEGRAEVAFDAIDDDNNASTPTNTDRSGSFADGIDCNGHGTHVAGTIGGKTYGVAKGVRLHSVRVMGRRKDGTIACDSQFGLWSEVIAGIDWVKANHVKPAVANISIGGSSDAADDAVRDCIAAGVTCVVAAGNSNMDASNFSPARVTEAITVGATDSSDTRASFSNFGSVLDVFAPGVDITSAWTGSDTATNTIPGTSMAAPHVTGVVALYLQNNLAALPATVSSWLISEASLGKVDDPGAGSPNRILYAHGIGFGEFYTTDGLGNLSLLKQHQWRQSWYMIIPGNFGGGSSIDLLFYDRAAGQGEIYTRDGQGNLSLLKEHSWRKSWDLIIPGHFGGDGFTDLLFYDRAAGQGEIYATDVQGNLSLLKQHTWRKSWDLIIPGHFGGDHSIDLLFYDRAAGQGEIYTRDVQGNLSLQKQHTWRKSWDLIIAGTFAGVNSWNALLFYDRAAGQGEIYTTDGFGNLSLLKQHIWRKSWDLIIRGNFGGNSWPDLLFYDRAAGQGEIYTTDGLGNLSLLKQDTWRKSWDLIIPGEFGGLAWTDLLFYQRWW
ncbi:MAG: S8 family peptidase [Acidobacteria bacterium]|nr:S8 family peptidase [Acidobacteriota bacterium]